MRTLAGGVGEPTGQDQAGAGVTVLLEWPQALGKFLCPEGPSEKIHSEQLHTEPLGADPWEMVSF